VTESRARLTTALADRYRIERELGQGGMATVYLAHDLKHGRDVAIKVLRPEITAILGSARFLQEIRISAQLDHPHILTLIDSGEAEGVLYYVLPYVRGESLRQKIARERQLSIEDALAITRQVASALNYAHRQGVIHRDIKPENILLHEGEAVVADFGIALALRQAGGQRLTESGLSLGTPQYMSPEQATGDRELDARSDIYSLAAVLYEMLAGEPPHTGPTVQAVIAKLLTERPTRLRVVRDTVPEGIDNAVAKALAKIPADRFASADAFVHALGPAAGTARSPHTLGSRFRSARPAIVGAVALVAALAVWLLLRGERRRPSSTYISRTQVTFTGNASRPALSRDGGQVAYVVHACDTGGCRYGIEVRDLAGGGARRLVDGAEWIDYLEWSSDRRFLLFAGIYKSKYGAFLVPVLGGPPTFLTSGFASFIPIGDSVLLTESERSDPNPWIWIATLAGERRDSFQLRHLGGRLLGGAAIPGTRWIGVGVATEAGVENRIVDRQGVESDHLIQGSQIIAPRVSGGAIWIHNSRPSSTHGPLVRVPLDMVRGKFGSAWDTVLDAVGEGVDVANDGGTIVYADGTYERGLWALSIDQALRGRFDPRSRLLASTSVLRGWLSPDGSRVLALRAEGDPSRGPTLTVLPWGGGAGVDIRPGSTVVPWVVWTPNGRIAYALSDSLGVRFRTVDGQSGTIEGTSSITDSVVYDFAPLGDSGWVWIPSPQRSIRLQYAADQERRDVPTPAGLRFLLGLQVSPDGRRIATEGIGQGESLLVYEVSLPGGAATRVAAFGPPVLWSYANWLADGGLLISVWHASKVVTLYRLRGSGHTDTLGTIPAQVDFAQSALDGRRVVVATSEFHGDIWIARRSVPR